MVRKKFIIAIALIILTSSVATAWIFLSKEPISFSPNWQAGKSWKTQVFSREQVGGNQAPAYSHSLWRFKVTDKDRVGNQTIYTVKASEDNKKKAGSIYILKFLYPDLTLISIAAYKGDELIKEEKPTSVAFFLNPQEVSLLPLDFSALPIFSLSRREKNQDLTLKKSVNFSNNFYSVNQFSEFNQQILAGRPVRKLKIFITANFNGSKIQNFQLWEEGKPWWTGARRFRNGKLESEAILIEY